ncbi:hypothetical protein [Nitrospirillum pindoramense]|uniref:Uncharacterized protein n=1 Tax=Nitrospirillum amazonense TaxID=28077 RepID=A0A560H6M3_9PROT|nr:hypothetical protein [Nitrospirillum amazonense]TWB41945.1 hypothetical protein FBZ90_107324 [Nitrospirillum amazonense]
MATDGARGALVGMIMAWVASLATGGAAAADGYDSYTNSRFDYTICYPRAFTPQREADNGDGRAFKAAGGAELLAFGAYNVRSVTARQGLDEAVADLKKDGFDVRYTALKQTWFVVSGAGTVGKDADRIVYQRTLFKGDTVVTARLTYPAPQAAAYAPFIKELGRCLRWWGG